MSKTLSLFSKMLLETFIDFSESVIRISLDYRQASREFYGGAPRGFYTTANNLKKQKYITVKTYKHNKLYCLTPKGRQTVAGFLIKHKIKKQKWDGKWRILIFDVPERKRNFRDKMRKTLCNLGFIMLQESVWLTPYNIIHDLYEIIPGFREGDWFEYIEAQHISSEDKFKKIFELR